MATATNASAIDFNVGSATQDATHFRIYTASTGGSSIWTDTLSNNPAALTANQFYRVPAGDIVLTFPNGNDGLQSAGSLRCANGFVSGGLHIELAESATGAAITNRVSVPQGSWTTAQ